MAGERKGVLVDASRSGGFSMRTRRLGASGPIVSEVGLGCMGMSEFYGKADRSAALETLTAALDAGVTRSTPE
jgi:hypothetical protein